MRTQTVGQIVVTYPDFMVYEGDNNFIMIKASGSTLSTLSVSLGNRRAMYSSDTDSVVVEVGSLMRLNDVYGRITLTVYVSRSEPAFSTTLSLVFYFCHGRTMPTRFHGSSRKIVLPYGQALYEVPVVASASVTDGTSTNPVADGEITMFRATDVEHTQAVVTYNTARLLGNYYDAEQTTTATFDVYRHLCESDGDVAIGWYDCDGCKRYAVGKVLSRHAAAEGVAYSNGGDVVRHYAEQIVATVSEVLEIGIADVSPDMFLGEIVYSQQVWLQRTGADNIPVVIEGDVEIDERHNMGIVLKVKTIA